MSRMSESHTSMFVIKIIFIITNKQTKIHTCNLISSDKCCRSSYMTLETGNTMVCDGGFELARGITFQ